MSKRPGQHTIEQDLKTSSRSSMSGKITAKIALLYLVVRLRQVHMRRSSNFKISVTGAVFSVGEVVNSPLGLVCQTILMNGGLVADLGENGGWGTSTAWGKSRLGNVDSLGNVD
jgi:hypothetical protein